MLAPGAACADWGLNMTEGVTASSREIYHLHMMTLWVCVAIGCIVFGIMAYSIVKHRKSKGAVAATFHESAKAEIIWMVIPVIILVSLAIPTAKALIRIEDSSNADMTIKVTGYQWKWEYEYPEEGIRFFSNLDPKSREASALGSGIDPATVDHYLREVDNPVVIPVGKKVRFLFTANDVIHSWWVPDLAIKKDAIPGFVNDMWTKVDKPGVYRGQCAELCGKGHAFMPIKVVAMELPGYQQWVAGQQRQAAAAVADSNKEWGKAELMAQGEKVFTSNCAACHQASGLGIPGVFPALKGSKIVTGDLSAHLETVLNGRPGTAMQAFSKQLTDADIAAVITYERNAFGNNTGDVLQPAMVKAARH
ncbi:cytochrome c oxidase subunit II [Candidatus Thiothrix sp. Deng01]|uniref:Cytochrome c oxidase subunit 2 n=1 Tax=Candidatus Thiothrix phosphatis TaxID=3112415 RepID=A0ABU6CXD0_9GAMM|nr:cytochrome c oxidase subunit II [Candidatus Thiothrix sp. Deng01]MEB4591491.1 cytochrome c oxidase subunit II [Candidatus Thiothrix sp. Deng01]